MRTLIAALIVAGIGFAVAAEPEPKAKKTVEEQIVGTWKLVKTDGTLPDDHTFTITYKKGGEMTFTRTPKDKDEKPATSAGKFKATEPDDKNKLGTIDWTVKEGDGERGEVSKIVALTATELVIQDPEGVKETFERVPEEKKDDKKDEKKKDDK